MVIFPFWPAGALEDAAGSHELEAPKPMPPPSPAEIAIAITENAGKGV
jgi:hypothetical protein